MAIDGLLNKGFVTTTLDTAINWLRTGSIWPVSFGLACTAVRPATIWTGLARFSVRLHASPT